MAPKRVGIVGYGHLGQYLIKAILEHPNLELAFVWNRSKQALIGKVDDQYICEDLEHCSQFRPDLIVEVAHPIISKQYGALFLNTADYLIGSPTALADQQVEDSLRSAASKNGLYVPAGAFWGGEDILKMADRGSLKGLKVTMKKHPSCFLLEGKLKDLNDTVTTEAVTLYDGPVRGLCPLAPNNVNTMAGAAIAAHNLGFDKVQGCLISDPDLHDWHIVEVEALGAKVAGRDFQVHTVRRNPADPGAVTGTATYASFFSSCVKARGKGPGVHLC